MIVAVASQDFTTVTQHAGKTRRFLLFDATAGQPVREVGRLDLAEGMAIHDFEGDGPHPLDQAKVVVAGSAGEGFIRRMDARGIVTVLTEQTDPVAAIRQYVEGALAPTAAESAGPCGCHGDH
ncbi:NifB/NifX family molybdenum-iron cluster-binding protein [Magnetospirillum fulvum]|uniref:Predicted Fe-Mo cluster-binding protein, NifX family n=1 Tax=Magnetospirillum fulvum TaxID=1082 RepID=A0A1H6HNV5_MAGFU|nr:nitrogen fixation protein [Magnetospirillum fulvum]SEH35854.1 Predicted Fe-Mo cluster-binding protein, NifX family [Magnetospirillum fulvum]